MAHSTELSVCLTLYEGDYEWGVGALANSLFKCGFRGTLFVGYRGSLPRWLPNDAHDTRRWDIQDGFRLSFFELPNDIGIHQLKSFAMIRVLDELAPDADKIFLFDADIIALAKWSYFEALADNAAVVVVDAWFPRVSMQHPWRRAWLELCIDAGLPTRNFEDYHGSAFLGVPRSRRSLADAWWRLTLKLHAQRPDIVQHFKPGDRMTDPFHGTDQDLLAAAIMGTDVPVCSLGPEAFGFTGAPHTMLHPAGMKPWRGSVLSRLLRKGIKPDLYVRNYFRYLKAPIDVGAGFQRFCRTLDIRCASALARVYG